MTFVLHRGERADVLADAAARILAEPLDDPFQTEVVAVHSRGIERWLSNRLAARLGATPASGRHDGVCANLEFPFPGHLVGRALAAATGVEAATDPWRPERLTWPLLDVVETNLDEPWLQVLAGYLGGDDPDTSDRDRRFGAVRHLADLFDRYAVHRPQMLMRWAAEHDEDGDGEPLPRDAVWQAELWRQLREVVGVASPPERLASGCQALVDDPNMCDLPRRILLFGLTRLPASYLDVLQALAVHRDVHLLALHPSAAAWETLATRSTETTPVGHDPYDGDGATAAVRHPLLQAWGRDSREMHLVLNRRLGSDIATEQYHPLPHHVPSTLLERLQHDLRSDLAHADRSATTTASPAPLLEPYDRSLQVHSCHGRTRQAEVVRDAVTHLLADDPTLEPRDIVIMCPDIDEMAPLLRAAFDIGGGTEIDPEGQLDHRSHRFGDGSGGEVRQSSSEGQPAIPYRLADRSLRQTNPVLGATAELLALIDARLTASQVLAFAALPPVRQRFALDDDDLARIAGWVEVSGIRWGLDSSHRAPFDLATVAAGTWESGLSRLLLGVAMSEDEQRLVGGVLPLDDVDSGDIDLVGRLAELVGRLGDAVSDLREPRTVAEWTRSIDRAADHLMHTRAVDAWQRGQLDRLLSTVAGEADTRGEGASPDADSGPTLRLAEIRDLLANRLKGQPSRRASFRTGDLTMCTLVPMRSVPHRVICLVGLDDGAFPRGGAPDGDDLLVRSRHVGDHDRRAEDRQLLLDAVLAAGDALVITYAGRDARTNEPLPPAVPVNELLDVVDATVRTATGEPARNQVVREHPLQPSDRRSFMPGELGTRGPWSFDPGLLGGARAAAQPKEEPRPFLPGPLPSAREDTIALGDLVAFVTHPARGFLRQRLGLSLRNEVDRPTDALSVELDGLEAWSVGDRILSALLAGGDIDTICRAEAARGLLPPGGLGHATLDQARRKAAAIAAAAEATATGQRTSLEVDLVLADRRRVVGTVPDVIGTQIRAATYSRLQPKRRLTSWVHYLAASAAHPELALASTTIGWGGQQPGTVTFAPLGTAAAERRSRAMTLLADLVDLRERGMREPLPLYCDTSFRYASSRRSGRDDPKGDAARYWTSEYKWDKEDREAEHLLVLGGQVEFDAIWDLRPTPTESGAGWAADEPTRFGRLARRLWDPILDNTGAGQ